MAGASDTRGEESERYRILGRLGEGGMGEVLRGVHVELGRDVAIKRLKSELSLDDSVIKRFENEARAVNLIRHENIVDVTDFYTDGAGRMHMVMELLEGRSLGDLIRSSAPLLPVRAAHIGAQIADALCAAHEHGVIHRDLKPENVFLIRRKSSDDYVKLLDFGIARLRPECGGIEATESGLILGTPVYMSPEQAKGAHVDESTDMYSLGVILYEMLSGHWPFPRSSAVQMMMAHIADEPKRLDIEGVPEGFGALIAECLAKEPKDRPQSMREVCERLESWGETTRFSDSEEIQVKRGLSDTFFPPSESTDERTWDRDQEPVRALSEEEMTSSTRPPNWVFGSLAGVLAMGAVAGWWLVKNREQPSESPADDTARVAAKSGVGSVGDGVGAERTKLDAMVAELRLPPIPSTCQATDAETIGTLLRSAEFLADGTPGSARPADTAALRALEGLGSDVSPEASLWRARANLQMGNAQEAIVEARLAQASCATLAAAHATEGTAHEFLGQHAAAIEKLKKAVSLEPTFVDARFNLALSQLASQQLTQALGSLSLVIEQDPGLAGAHYLRGQCALQLGDSAAAVVDLTVAVGEQSDNAAAWYALGYAQHDLGKLVESNDAYCQARKLGDARAPCNSENIAPPPKGDWETDSPK